MLTWFDAQLGQKILDGQCANASDIFSTIQQWGVQKSLDSCEHNTTQHNFPGKG